MQAFDALSQQEQLQRLQPITEKTLPLYGLQTATSTLLQYEDNAVYRLVSSTGAEFVLRISAADGHSAAAQFSEAQWLLALRRATDLLVPAPILNAEGAPVTAIEIPEVAGPRHCVLFSWVPGEPPTQEISPKVAARIGAFTARLHTHAEQFIPPAGFIRPRWDWQHVCGLASSAGFPNNNDAPTPVQRALLAAASTRLQTNLHALGTSPDQWGLIHADLHRDNILLQDEQVGVIDFDDCGWGYYLYDVACVLDSFRRRVVTDPRAYPTIREAYLAGYNQVRHLPDQLEAQLATFKALRDLVTLNFILASRNAAVQEWGPARAEQIMEHMQGYMEGKILL